MHKLTWFFLFCRQLGGGAAYHRGIKTIGIGIKAASLPANHHRKKLARLRRYRRQTPTPPSSSVVSRIKKETLVFVKLIPVDFRLILQRTPTLVSRVNSFNEFRIWEASSAGSRVNSLDELRNWEFGSGDPQGRRKSNHRRKSKPSSCRTKPPSFPAFRIRRWEASNSSQDAMFPFR